MTKWEAINVMEKYTDSDTISPVVENAHLMAIAALEKQIPADADAKNEFKFSIAFDGKCPVCHVLTSSHMRYCCECGQALKWD